VVAPKPANGGQVKTGRACPRYLGRPRSFCREAFTSGLALDYAVAAGSRLLRAMTPTGQGTPPVVRAPAFKCIRIAFLSWENGVAYDESGYLATIIRRAPLPSASMVACTLKKTLGDPGGDSEEKSRRQTTNHWPSYSDVCRSCRIPRVRVQSHPHSPLRMRYISELLAERTERIASVD
jgi:hypothetical protein